MQIVIFICFCFLKVLSLPINSQSTPVGKKSDIKALYDGSGHLVMALVFSNNHTGECNDSYTWMDPIKPHDTVSTAVTTALPPTTTTTTAKACLGSGFTLIGNHCYYFSSQKATWINALNGCRGRNSTLAYPQNAEEAELLAKHVHVTNQRNWWIGGTDESSEGEWVWTHSKAKVNYINWANGQPNDHLNQDCLLISVYSQKAENNDEDCDVDWSFVCQQ